MTEGNGSGQPSPLELKRWHRIFYRKTAVSFELKRLKRHENRPLQKMLTKVFAKMAEGAQDNLTPAQQVEILDEVYALMPEEELKRWFSQCVQKVEGLVIDGQSVTTGQDLLEEADDDLVLFILTQLFALSKFQVPEGNASASRSTSSPALTEESSSSAATSTGGEAGTEPSTAEPIPAGSESFSQPVGA
jgi:hypothetical protein